MPDQIRVAAACLARELRRDWRTRTGQWTIREMNDKTRAFVRQYMANVRRLHDVN